MSDTPYLLAVCHAAAIAMLWVMTAESQQDGEFRAGVRYGAIIAGVMTFVLFVGVVVFTRGR